MKRRVAKTYLGRLEKNPVLLKKFAQGGSVIEIFAEAALGHGTVASRGDNTLNHTLYVNDCL